MATDIQFQNDMQALISFFQQVGQEATLSKQECSKWETAAKPTITNVISEQFSQAATELAKAYKTRVDLAVKTLTEAQSQTQSWSEESIEAFKKTIQTYIDDMRLLKNTCQTWEMNISSYAVQGDQTEG